MVHRNLGQMLHDSSCIIVQVWKLKHAGKSCYYVQSSNYKAYKKLLFFLKLRSPIHFDSNQRFYVLWKRRQKSDKKQTLRWLGCLKQATCRRYTSFCSECKLSGSESGSTCKKIGCFKNKVTKFGCCLVFLTALEPCGASGPTHRLYRSTTLMSEVFYIYGIQFLIYLMFYQIVWNRIWIFCPPYHLHFDNKMSTPTLAISSEKYYFIR